MTTHAQRNGRCDVEIPGNAFRNVDRSADRALPGNVKQDAICADVQWRGIRRVQRLRRRRALGIRQSQPVYSEEQSSRLVTGQRGTPSKFNHSPVGLFDRACATFSMSYV